MSREQSSIGASQHYGPRVTNEGLDNSVSTYGVFNQRELRFDYSQVNAGLPTVNADTDSAVLLIPANSLITRAYIEVGTAFTSGGSATLEVGVQQSDGTVVDADGIDSVAVAALTAGSYTVADGAIVGASVGANDVQLSIDYGTAVFTAGTGRLIVEYVEPVAE